MYTAIARYEKNDITGDIILHLIHPDTHVELHEGDIFLTVQLKVDPWADTK
jgi:hypothetical protein